MNCFASEETRLPFRCQLPTNESSKLIFSYFFVVQNAFESCNFRMENNCILWSNQIGLSNNATSFGFELTLNIEV